MSFTGEVSEFIKTLGPTFYEYVDESDDESMTVKEKEDSGIEADCKLDNEVLAILNQKPTDDNYYSDDSSVHSGSVETVQLGQRRVSGSSADEYHDPLTEVKTSSVHKECMSFKHFNYSFPECAWDRGLGWITRQVSSPTLQRDTKKLSNFYKKTLKTSGQD